MTTATTENGATMPDHYQLNPFLTAKVEAEARRQHAIRDAHEAFGRAYLLEKARHAAAYERASAAWDVMKSNPSAKVTMTLGVRSKMRSCPQTIHKSETRPRDQGG